MKDALHPTSQEVTFICSCGAEYTDMSTLKQDTIRVEICSNCHPQYTGEQRILKTGSVDKYYARQKKMEELQKSKGGSTGTSATKKKTAEKSEDTGTTKKTKITPKKEATASEIKAEEVVIVDKAGKAKVEEEVVKETGDKEEVIVTAQEVDEKEAQGETIEEIVEEAKQEDTDKENKKK